jgi:sugar lactone lactonase YvrE
MRKVVETFSNTRSVLGEGPAWDGATGSLIWVDIRGDKVFAKSYETAEEQAWSVPNPSAAIPAGGDNLLITSGHALLRLSRMTGKVETVLRFHGEPKNNRCNDAKCDPLGRLWVGTMDDSKRISGQLWRVEGSGESAIILKEIGISNTLAWDLPRKRFYFADSLVGDIYVFDYDPSTGRIGNRRVFLSRDSAPGVPDGSALDEQGYLWNARWDGSCVVRISPAGKVDTMVDLPVLRPTSCAFGGPDMQTLFVTSAVAPSTCCDPKSLNGVVLTFRAGVGGSPIPHFCDSIGAPNRGVTA